MASVNIRDQKIEQQVSVFDYYIKYFKLFRYKYIVRDIDTSCDEKKYLLVSC